MCKVTVVPLERNSYYVKTDEHGYMGSFTSRALAEQYRNNLGYGSIVYVTCDDYIITTKW